jgi:hypothetical protein
VCQWLPKNWPENKITYTPSVVWSNACRDLYKKYQEHSTLEECTEVKMNAKGLLEALFCFVLSLIRFAIICLLYFCFVFVLFCCGLDVNLH